MRSKWLVSLALGAVASTAVAQPPIPQIHFAPQKKPKDWSGIAFQLQRRETVTVTVTNTTTSTNNGNWASVSYRVDDLDVRTKRVDAATATDAYSVALSPGWHVVVADCDNHFANSSQCTISVNR